jgi:hypothetical protein
MNSPSRAICLAALLFFVDASQAQTAPEAYDPGSDPALIEKGLSSTLPLQVAISAYRAKQDPFRWRTQLRQALARSSSLQPEAEAVRTRRIIFDALIKSGTPVPLEELLPFFNQFPAAVIAVVARTGNSNGAEDRVPLLISAEGLENRTYWSAAASLVDHKRLVHHLAQQVWFDYAVQISDRDFDPVQIHAPLPRGVPGGFAGGIIGGIPNGRVSWPEETAYRLSATGRPTEALTSGIGGRVYLIAEPYYGAGQGEHPDEDTEAWGEHDRDVVHLLLSFAHCSVCSRSTPDFPMIRGGKAFVFWTSEDRARRALMDGIEEYVRQCKGMLDTLGETGFSEAEIRSRVRIWIQDSRQSRTIPIPAMNSGVQINHCQNMAGYCGK